MCVCVCVSVGKFLQHYSGSICSIMCIMKYKIIVLSVHFAAILKRH